MEWQLDQVTRERVPPKTPKSRRVILLPDVAGEALARHIATYPPLPDGSLFYGENGRVWSQRRYGAVFSAAVARLAARGFPADTTSHKLRHTFASWVLHVTGDPVRWRSCSGTRTRRWS